MLTAIQTPNSSRLQKSKLMEYRALSINVHTIRSICVSEHELLQTFFHDTLVFSITQVREENTSFPVPFNYIILIFVNPQPKISITKDILYYIQELGSSLIYLCDSLNV